MFGKSIGTLVVWCIGAVIGLVVAALGLRKSWPALKKFGREVKEEADKQKASKPVSVADEAF